jgi:predicted glycoside hydrolase/deacetylase ChbG (UPF0249 family)
LIVNADDFGWTDGHNQAVELAHCHGVLNRASIMPNAPAFWEGVKLAKRLPSLQVGVHLTLNEGNSLLASKYLPNLTNGEGSFFDTLNSLIILWGRGRLRATEAKREWRAQVERVLQTGIRVTHLDSHKHVHVLPPLLEAAVQLAQEFHIPYLRLPLESSLRDLLRRGPAGVGLWMLAMRAKTILQATGLQFSQRFIGLGMSGRMTLKRLGKAICAARGTAAEIMVHPAVITASVLELQQKYRWATRYQFEKELQALCDREIIQIIERQRA